MSFRSDIFRARINEIIGRWSRAEEIVRNSVSPRAFVSLKEVYALRLKVFISPVHEGSSIIRNTEFGDWFTNQVSNEEQYAAMYVQYMLAGVQGETQTRLLIAGKLKTLPVKRIYRSLLLVTD